MTLMLIIGGSQVNQAEAYRHHVGQLYDGRQVYLLTETLRGTYDDFNCIAVASGRYEEEIHYSFWRSNGSMYYRNSLRGQNMLVSSSNIATNILNYYRGY
ncbi:MAG: hypothetical protein IKZ58_03720 [Selenomonadaceae bacterium]|nr:hypothetical protein [Selenomonadaceae bacterium]